MKQKKIPYKRRIPTNVIFNSENKSKFSIRKEVYHE